MGIRRFVELCFGYVIVWNFEGGDFLARSGRSEIPSNIATCGPLSVTVGLSCIVRSKLPIFLMLKTISVVAATMPLFADLLPASPMITVACLTAIF